MANIFDQFDEQPTPKIDPIKPLPSTNVDLFADLIFQPKPLIHNDYLLITALIITLIGMVLGWKMHKNASRNQIEKYRKHLEQQHEQKLEALTETLHYEDAVCAISRWAVAKQAAHLLTQNISLITLADAYPRLILLPSPTNLTELLFLSLYEQEEQYPLSYSHRIRFGYLKYIRTEAEKTTNPRRPSPINYYLIKDKGYWLNEYRNKQALPDGRMPIDWQWRRQIVISRDKSACQRCGFLVKTKAHIHHIHPRQEEGNHSFENLILLCEDCHTCMPDHEWMRDKKQLKQFWKHSAIQSLIYILNETDLNPLDPSDIHPNDLIRFKSIPKKPRTTSQYLKELEDLLN